MANRSFLGRWSDCLRRFASHKGGNVTLIFSLTSICAFGAVGLAVDNHVRLAVETNMQTALDAAALNMSLSPGLTNQTSLSRTATALFWANFSDKRLKNAKVTATAMENGKRLTLSVDGTIDTSFMAILGQRIMTVEALSEVTRGIRKLRLALVLDNTGSMNDNGKLGSLKDATHKLLDQLKSAASSPGDVDVSIVPFNTAVNVGTGNVTASWLDWRLYKDPAGAGSANWQGCVIDRDQNHDVANTTPQPGDAGTLFPTTYTKSCPLQMTGLTHDWNQLNQMVSDMTAQGRTNQTIGLAWGWQTLSSNAPFNYVAPPGRTDRIIVLFTDGLNTQNRWTSSSSEIDQRMELACNNAKADNVTIYTVQVKGNGDPTSAILQDCASAPDKFFPLDSPDQISDAFESIGRALSLVHLSR